jgi:signal transduction histidine kinase
MSMANIASSARSSLQDVRQVLTSTNEPTGASPGELHDLVDNVRASGHEVLLSEVGATRSLAPELATVAYRVLQEMLTNAIRHGRRDIPVEVELHWGGELRIETVNVVAGREEDDVAPGQGLDGMRRRLESVGGRLDVRRRGTEDQTFTATAWVPVRTVYS